MIVFATLGFGDIVRESKYEYVVRCHYRKIARYLAGEWPQPMPERVMFEGEYYALDDPSDDNTGV